MDLRVAGHEVFLTLHRTYCADDDSTVLQAVSKFKPLMDYLTKLNTEGFQLSSLTVRNVQYVATRIVSVTMDTLFASSKKGERDTVSECITLSDDCVCVYLPVLQMASGEKLGVLVNQCRPTIGGQAHTEAFFGVQLKPGSFSGSLTELLANASIPLDGLTVIPAPHDLIVGNEGIGPIKLLTSTKANVTEADVQTIQGLTSPCGAKLVVEPLQDILSSSSDLRATVAAALLLKA
mmetsp:Transcript_66519/g.77190  ORF Transcript_66519/g.77190 Transcript_66519/m.77190 type:complete len:235 (+) Transcript_66519:59-763(+)